jgi:aminoglycoside phosphotransferase (APT) family kinase protein
MMEGTAGDRWEEFYRTCRRVIDSDQLFFDDAELAFAYSMEKRLDRYQADTYVSTAQINWLNRLSQKVRDHGL